MQTSFVLVVGASFILAGFVKGVVGLGLPTVAMGLLSLVMPPVQAAALLIVPSMITNVWQLAAGPGVLPLLRRLWPLLACAMAGTLLGGALLPGYSGAWAVVALGVALIAYALAGLCSLRLTVVGLGIQLAKKAVMEGGILINKTSCIIPRAACKRTLLVHAFSDE